MKKIIHFKILFYFLIFPLFSLANYHSLNIGYSFDSININSFTNLNKPKKFLDGINIKYHFESSFPFGIINSLSFSKNFSYNYPEYPDNYFYIRNIMKNLLFMSGPSYRFNNYISFYGIIGKTFNIYDFNVFLKKDYIKIPFYYSLGIQINPINNFVIDISYQRKVYNNEIINKNKTEINSNKFILGLGIRF